MTISFPHMGNYSIPIEIMLKSIFPDAHVLTPPPITKRTQELGAQHSPDFVCVPFKYNLGNYIQALEAGADVLLQSGGGCRYGFYGELQEQILKDLGYKFTFINLLAADGLNLFKLHKLCRRLGSPLSLPALALKLLLIIKMIKAMDALDFYMRENMGFEVVENSFVSLHNLFLADLKAVNSFHGLNKLTRRYEKLFKGIEVCKPDKVLRVGIVGELYDIMEPFANYFMEKELAKNGIAVTRYINVTYLLFQKKRLEKKTLARAGKYLRYTIGADGTDSVADCLTLAKRGYDGIIHIKPFGCTPEVNAMPMLMNINKEHKIPILYFSFDSQTSETGIKTRLEAFYDMLSMKNNNRLIPKPTIT